MLRKVLTMENLAWQQFAKLVYDYCGLDYRKNLDALEMKLAKRLKTLQMPTLWRYMSYLDNNTDEWGQVVEILTINETYFYREDKQLNVYQQHILPTLTGPVNVWSAACSTGEEPYSLAIMSKQAGRDATSVQITATDINQRVLQVAKQGAYAKRSLSFRRIPPAWLEAHFLADDTHYYIDPTVQQMVHFDYLNLLDIAHNGPTEQFDVIFCRNVLIYFDEATIKRVVSGFHRALKKGGHLFLGHAETISHFDIDFKTVHSEGTFYYQKG